jgi:hypothetical protein
MKKLFVKGILPMILSASLTLSAASQEIAMDTRNRPATTKLYVPTENESESVSINEIDKRAVKSFNKAYGNISGARWFRADKGYGVSFKENEIRTTIFYSKNGAEESRINYYAEEKLPVHVRTLLKSNFPDFTISHVAEVNKKEVVSHVVTLQYKNTIKKVKVIDNEWEVMETLVKN